MSTNGINACEDTEMAECDGEKVVTMMDVLKEQEDFEEDVNAVLGASDDKNCTYSKGYIKRQAIYACRTCCPEAADDPDRRAGVCLACSLNCHEKHELIELYTKRNFRCDCGNHKFNSHPCQFTPTKTEINEENSYNQNFSGVYCTCRRPYPDPEATTEQEMIQCIVCEDWFHSSHLDAVVPPNEDYSEMICKDCMNKNEFLYDYTEHTVNKDNLDVDILNISPEFTDTANEISVSNTKKFSNNDTGNDNEIKMDSDNIENVIEKTKLTQQCDIEPQSTDENIQEESLEHTCPMIEEKENIIELSKDDTDVSENKDYVKESLQLELTVTKNSVSDDIKENNSETKPNNIEQIEEMQLLNNSEPEPEEIKESKCTTNNTHENILETDLKNCEQTEKNKLTESCDALQLRNSLNCEKNSTELITAEINKELAEEDLLLRDPVENEDINKPITTNASASENLENNDDISDARDITSEDIISESNAENPKDCETLKTMSKSEIECTEDSKAHNEDTSADFIMNENNENENIISNVANEDQQDNDTIGDNDKHENDTIENEVIEDNANTDDNKKEDDNTTENKHIQDNDNLKNKQANNDEQEADITDNETQDDIKGNMNHIECTDETVTQASIQKRKLPTESDENELEQKKQKMDERACVRPRGVTRVHKGATFWLSNFRHQLCTCNECILMYKDLSVLFLIDPDDTVTAYEQLGKEKTHGKPASQYEKGMAALSSLGRVQQINALTEYSKLRDKLLEFLKSFKERKVIVKEEDIKAFFAGMKPVREPDGVYFCR